MSWHVIFSSISQQIRPKHYEARCLPSHTCASAFRPFSTIASLSLRGNLPPAGHVHGRTVPASSRSSVVESPTRSGRGNGHAGPAVSRRCRRPACGCTPPAPCPVAHLPLSSRHVAWSPALLSGSNHRPTGPARRRRRPHEAMGGRGQQQISLCST